jgi:hypothetical protein
MDSDAIFRAGSDLRWDVEVIGYRKSYTLAKLAHQLGWIPTAPVKIRKSGESFLYPCSLRACPAVIVHGCTAVGTVSILTPSAS